MPRVLFVGISTGGSLIHRVFPAWMGELGKRASIVGVDLPHDGPEVRYRKLLAEIRHDEHVLGAVLTSHKVGLYRAARDLATAGDPYVDLLREINAIAKDGQALTVHAR